MPRPISVFISHKDRDKDLAREVKRLLLSRADKDRLRVFASSDGDVLPGKLWFPQIHKELSEANSLILLYTDQRQIWDWCFYEAGYFAGGFGDVDKVNNLFVFHPRRVPRPAPLQQWQAVIADPGAVEGVLQHLYRTPRGGSSFDGNEQDRGALARDIAKAMEVYEPVSILPPLSYFLTLEGVPVENGAGAGGAGGAGPAMREPAYRVTVVPDDGLAVKLGLPQRATYKLEDFLKLEEVKRARLDGDLLPKLIGGLLDNRTVSNVPLPAVLLDGNGYRPIIDDASLTRGYSGRVRIGFQRVPANLDVTTSYALEALSEIIRLAVRFRAAVVDQYARAIDPDPGQPPPVSDATPQAKAKPLLYDIEAHISEALAAGLNSENALLRAFRDSEHGRVRTIILDWHAGLEALRRTASNQNASADDLRNAFRALRAANFAYLRTAAAELEHVVRNLQPPPEVRLSPPPAVASNERPWWKILLGL